MVCTRAPETQTPPRCPHPESAAAALPAASKVGPVRRRHASAPIHHLPGWWVHSLSADRQLPLTMGETAALPQRLWQQEKNFLQKEYVKLLQILDATWYYASSQLNDHTQ